MSRITSLVAAMLLVSMAVTATLAQDSTVEPKQKSVLVNYWSLIPWGKNADQTAQQADLSNPAVQTGLQEAAEQESSAATPVSYQDHLPWDTITDDPKWSEPTERAPQLRPQQQPQVHAESFLEPDVTSQLVVQTNVSHAAPALRVITYGPEQANVYQPCRFRFEVLNEGPVIAEAVVLTVNISENAKIVATVPQNALQQRGTVYFQIGNLQADDSRSFEIELDPVQAGQIQVQPRISLASTSQMSVRTSEPRVAIEVVGNEQIVAGSQISERVVIRNTGTEPIHNVKIQHACSPQTALNQVTFDADGQTIDNLEPGQARDFVLSATAVKPGKVQITFAVHGDNIRDSANHEIEIRERSFGAEFDGPELIYINSVGTWFMAVTNHSNEPARNVNVILDIPPGMEIKVIDRPAEMDKQGATLTWNLPMVPAGHTEYIPFKALISAPGASRLTLDVEEGGNTVARTQMSTHVVGRADIDLKLITQPAPVEVGSSATIELIVQNRGTQPAEDIEIVVELPAVLQPTASSEYQIDGNDLVVQRFPLQVGQSRRLAIELTGAKAGEHLIRATVQSASGGKPISTEGRLFFFSGTPNRVADRDE